MKQLESTIQSNCIKWYKKTYPKNYIRKNDQITSVGDPDIIICHFGLFVAIEMKQPGKNPTPLQKIKIDKVLASGGIAGVAHSLDEFKQIIKQAECPEIGGTNND